MGFWVMLLAIVVGVVVLVAGARRRTQSPLGWVLAVAGLVCIGAGIWLALPQ